jgi:serine O-acetyltransferase
MGLLDRFRMPKIIDDARHQLNGPFHVNPQRWTPIRALRIALAPEFRLIAWYRLYSSLHEAGHRKLAHLLYLRTKSKFGCDIACEAKIGRGIRIAHPSDIVIGPSVQIGDEVVIFNGVTLGNRLGKRGEGMPTIGNRVLIGTGAKVLGPIGIADGARIGANAVVLDDVPRDRTAVGNPARVL